MPGDYAKTIGPLITFILLASAVPSEKWTPGSREIVTAIALLCGLISVLAWPLSRLVNDVAAIRKEIEDEIQTRNIN